MTPVTSFNGKHAAVFGLGGSGFVTAQALVAGGARVAVWDDNEHAREKAPRGGSQDRKSCAGRLAEFCIACPFARRSVNASGAALDRAEGEAGRGGNYRRHRVFLP